MANIVAIKDIRTRPPEHGRIRFGEKFTGTSRNGRRFEAPRAIDRFRFTSPDRDAIEQLAELYGGECVPWNDPKASPQHQFEVTTESGRISVLLPQDCYTVAYELWGGRGIERRCDGESCTFYGGGRPMVRECACASQREQTCKPYSRVNVILPQVSFGGVWRLEVKGKAFMHEAPGMIATIQQMQSNPLVRVDILLTKRTSRGVDEQGKPTVNHFIVPQFTVNLTPDEMMAGLGSVKRLELESAPAAAPALAAVPEDDEVVDAEIIDLWGAEPDDGDLAPLLEESVRRARMSRQTEEEPAGWDRPPPHVRTIRNPDPAGPKWIRRPNGD